MKRLLAVALSVSMMCSLVGCGSGQESTITTDSVSAENVNPAGTFPIVKEPITLKVMASQHALVEDLKTNEFTQRLEELTGIIIEWQTVPESNSVEKLNVLLSTGTDLPDVFLGFNINMTQQISIGEEQGLFVNLDPYLNEYAPNVLAMYEKEPVLEGMSRTPSGGVYGILGAEEAFHVKYPSKMWIQQSYLDTLGKELPETTEDFKELLLAIKNEDPNGNGKADEIPLTGATTGWETRVLPFIMSAFVEYHEVNGIDSNISFTINDGKIDAAFTQDGFKEGLIYMNELVEEGLLDPGAFTQDQQQLKTLTGNEANYVGVVAAGAPLAAVSGIENAMNWISLKPLIGPSGNEHTRYVPQSPLVGRFVVTKECENIEAAVRLADYFVSEEGTLNSVIGVEGVDWKYIEDDSLLGINGEPAVYERITPYGEQQNKNWEKIAPVFLYDELRNGMLAEGGPLDMETKLYNEAKDKYEQFNSDRYILPVTVLEDDMTEFVDITTSLATYLSQTTAEFIVGARDIEAEWDKYLQTLDAIGVDRLIEIMNTTYENQYGTLGLE